MMRASNSLFVCAALSCVGCMDFIEPDLAAENAAATISVSALQENDSSLLLIDAVLVPGLDEDGFRRRVVRDTLIAFGLSIAPSSIRRKDNRVYEARQTVTNPASIAFTVDPPLIEGLPQRPSIRWFGLRKVGADTIRLRRGEDLILRVDTSLGASQPTPETRNWSLQLVGKRNEFRLGGSGMPPTTIIVPAMWIPALPDTVLRATLLFNQSAVLIASNYRGLYNHFVRTNWTVILQ
jgi:hypothetical protein